VKRVLPRLAAIAFGLGLSVLILEAGLRLVGALGEPPAPREGPISRSPRPCGSTRSLTSTCSTPTAASTPDFLVERQLVPVTVEQRDRIELSLGRDDKRKRKKGH
jgi:hypothetical protein